MGRRAFGALFILAPAIITALALAAFAIDATRVMDAGIVKHLKIERLYSLSLASKQALVEALQTPRLSCEQRIALAVDRLHALEQALESSAAEAGASIDAWFGYRSEALIDDALRRSIEQGFAAKPLGSFDWSEAPLEKALLCNQDGLFVKAGDERVVGFGFTILYANASTASFLSEGFGVRSESSVNG